MQTLFTRLDDLPVFPTLPIFFIVLWCSVCVCLAYISGWRRLAVSYRAQGPPAGMRYIMQSGKVGPVYHRGSLTVYSSPTGLYLRPLLLFRLAHPALLIPWDALDRPRSWKFLWQDMLEVDVGTPPITSLRLSRRILEPYIAST